MVEKVGRAAQYALRPDALSVNQIRTPAKLSRKACGRGWMFITPGAQICHLKETLGFSDLSNCMSAEAGLRYTNTRFHFCWRIADNPEPFIIF